MTWKPPKLSFVLVVASYSKIDFEYSHTLDSETWTVEELDEWPKHRDPVDNG